MYKNLFVWDEDKYEENLRKHGITFHEASSVFDDEHAIEKYDPDHSQNEDRFIILGYSALTNLLLVAIAIGTAMPL